MASESFIKANEDSVPAESPRKDAAPKSTLRAEPLATEKAKGPIGPRFLVLCHSVRKRLADSDGLCPKFLLDQLRYAGWLNDDTPEEIQALTTQRRAQKGEEEHTMITVLEIYWM